MNWKLILIGIVVLSILVYIAYYYNKTSSFVRQGFQNASARNEFIMYYADWCPHCKSVLPAFTDFAADGKIAINGQDVYLNKYESTKDADKLKGKNIKGFPTFVLTTIDGNTIEYKGPRTTDEYLKFLNQNLGGNI